MLKTCTKSLRKIFEVKKSFNRSLRDIVRLYHELGSCTIRNGECHLIQNIRELANNEPERIPIELVLLFLQVKYWPMDGDETFDYLVNYVMNN